MCYFPANVLTRHTQTHCVLCVGSQCVIARTDRRNGTQIGMCTFCIDQYILLYCWIDRHCWLSDTTTVFLVVLVQCAWHVSNCFLGFCLFVVRDVTRTSIKPTFVLSVKPDSLKHIWLNVNITTEAPKSTDVSKWHVNKDLYSIQELCHNIGTLL